MMELAPMGSLLNLFRVQHILSSAEVEYIAVFLALEVSTLRSNEFQFLYHDLRVTRIYCRCSVASRFLTKLGSFIRILNLITGF